MEKRVRPSAELGDKSELPSRVPQGGPLPLAPPEPVPERTPENLICLRGPCRHYWYLKTMAQAGNPQGTWEALNIPSPRKHHHICLVQPGVETEFEGDNCFDCSRWDPLTKREKNRLSKRRGSHEKVSWWHRLRHWFAK